MNKLRNQFLVGLMSAGKSVAARHLARLLHLEFADSDEEIETRTSVDIPFIFEKEGEKGFRKREVKVIDELSQREGVVLATRGGAIPLRKAAVAWAPEVLWSTCIRPSGNSSSVHREGANGHCSKTVTRRKFRKS